MLALLGVALSVSACASDQSAAGESFDPVTPGTLTVATAFLPAPGFWEGNPPTRGFEAGLASALADHLGLHRVRVVQVPFTAIIHGHLGGADLALSGMTPSEEREQFVDFSTPYLTAPPGVLARRGVEASDVHGLRPLRWVVARVSTLTPVVMDSIRPLDPPVVVEDRAAVLRVLRAGRADVALLDLPVALGLAHVEPRTFHVLGQLSNEEGLAAVLPKGSDNREVVDSAIRSLQADGTIDDLETRWLGESESDVPLILTEQ